MRSVARCRRSGSTVSSAVPAIEARPRQVSSWSGAEAASRRYFRVPASGLGPDQAAHLAAMIPNPRYYERNQSARGLLKRKAIIAARMVQVSVPR